MGLRSKLTASCVTKLLESHTIGDLGQNQAVLLVHIEDTLLGDDHISDLVSGQRQCALLKNLWLVLLGCVRG